MDYLVQDLGKKNLSYKSMVIKDSSNLSVLSNKLSMKIVKELSEKPACAMDLARKLKEHEQKIYYHIRKLEEAGLIKLMGTEERTGGTAKMYGVPYQAISLKLTEKGEEIPDIGLDEAELLKPFVEGGKLNCKIIVGSPYPHGKYEARGTDGCFAIDIGTFLGNKIVNPSFPAYLFDTETKEDDLKENLIIIGGPITNITTEKINKVLPIYFLEEDNWVMFSKKTKRKYTDSDECIISRLKNPFNPEKEIIFIAGRKWIGTKVGSLAFCKNFDLIMKPWTKNKKDMGTVLKGLDKTGDGKIDSIKILE